MGLFGIDSPKERKRKRYKKSKMAEFERLNQKWTATLQAHGFGAQLDRDCTKGSGRTGGMLLSWKEMDDAAYEYADKKAEASLTWYQSLVSGNGFAAIASFVVAVVVAVVSVICPPVAVAGVTLFGGLSVSTGIAVVVSATAAYVATSAMRFSDYKASGLGGLAIFEQSKTAFLRNRSQAEQQSYALTNLIIYGEYSIYANGSIYNQGSAGAGQTFSPTIPYDATKGIRGDLKKEPLDETITGRVGGDLAGGQNFHSNVMNLEVPLAKFELSAAKIQERNTKKYISASKLTAAAFSELGDASFNADNNAVNVYNRVLQNLQQPIKKTFYTNDFINKIKNYNKNLRADFDYFTERKFKKKNQEATSWENLIGDKEFMEVMKSNEFNGKQKCEMFVEKICEIFDLLQEMSEATNAYGCWGWINGYYYPASDWDNVIYRRSSMHKDYSSSGRAREAAEAEILYKGHIHDTMQEGILKAGAWTIGYFSANKKYKGDELLELLRECVISKLLTRGGLWGFYYNANVARGILKSDYNKVWRKLKWTYDGYAWWEYTQTLYNYQCFMNLGKESYEFLQEFYELGQSDMIQNYLFSTEIEVQNAPE